MDIYLKQAILQVVDRRIRRTNLFPTTAGFNQRQYAGLFNQLKLKNYRQRRVKQA